MSNQEKDVNLRVPFQQVRFPFPESTPLKIITESGETAPLQREGRVSWIPAEHLNCLHLDLNQVHTLLNQLDLKITIELRRVKENDKTMPSIGSFNSDGSATASRISFADPNERNKPKEKGNEHYIIFLDYDNAQAEANYNLEKTAELIDKQLKQSLIDILWIKHKKEINSEIRQASFALIFSLFPILPFLILDAANNTSTISAESILIFLFFYLISHDIYNFLTIIFFDKETDDNEKLMEQDNIKGYFGNKFVEAMFNPDSSLRMVMDHEKNRHRTEVNQIYLWLSTLLSHQKNFDITHPIDISLSTISYGLVSIKNLLYFSALKIPIIPGISTGITKALASAITLIEKKPLIISDKK